MPDSIHFPRIGTHPLRLPETLSVEPPQIPQPPPSNATSRQANQIILSGGCYTNPSAQSP